MSGGAKLGIAGTAVAVLAALCLAAWIGGELHYRNCLQGVELRYGSGGGLGGYGSRLREESNPWAPGGNVRGQRDRAISSCSRWP